MIPKRAAIPEVMLRVAALFVSVALVCSLACDREGVDDGVEYGDSDSVGPVEPAGPLQEAELREDDGIVDGDTFRAVGFGQAIRPLCIDAEEVLEGDEKAEARSDWEAYRKRKTADADGPVSYGTFLGNEATEWAEAFFERHGPRIWVEYESPKRTRGYFGRHLGYVWVKEDGDGDWLNFNIELVRAGMSPYYTPFGRCAAYDRAFREAQREARRARRGIWAAGARAYDDYDERMRTWERRADQIEEFRDRFENTGGIVELGTDTAMARLRVKMGRRVVVFGAVDRLVGRADPPRLELFHRHRQPFGVVAGDSVNFEDFDLRWEDEDYVYAFGVVEMYRGSPRLRLDPKSFIVSGGRPPALEVGRQDGH